MSYGKTLKKGDTSGCYLLVMPQFGRTENETIKNE
jgi:hypothetical protein